MLEQSEVYCFSESESVKLVKLLEVLYLISSKVLGGIAGKYGDNRVMRLLFVKFEWVTKKPIFGCQMCGQCILHETGMSCPMGCPKEIRNGPCGGVRTDGSCELDPKMTCVWVTAWENSNKMRVFSHEIELIQKPLDRRLKGSSAWINQSRL